MAIKTNVSFGMTGGSYDKSLVTATSGCGITVKAGTQSTASLLLKKKIAAERRKLFK